MIIVIGDDIAEEIVWVASRPDHVNIAQTREFFSGCIRRELIRPVIMPVNQATATIKYVKPQ